MIRGETSDRVVPVGFGVCLLGTLSLEWADRPQHPRLRRRDLDALKSLHDRLRKEYDAVYGEVIPLKRYGLPSGR
jgi:hypothetical protein